MENSPTQTHQIIFKVLIAIMSIHQGIQDVRRLLQAAVSQSRNSKVNPQQVRRLPSQMGNSSIEERYLRDFHVEEWEMVTDDEASTSQCYLPFRVVKPVEDPPDVQKKYPVVMFLHPTGGDRNYHIAWESRYVSRGYMTVSVDSRYHGRRQDSQLSYQRALVKAYSEQDCREKPFLLDNVWDQQRILDVLETRDDVDMSRIGVTGMSLGGMHSWLLAACDERIACACPICGVQYFRYALENDCYYERVMSIPDVFRYAVETSSNKKEGPFPLSVSKETVQHVWDRLLPGMLEHYDADVSLGAIAPRPFLIVTGCKDARNPIKGIEMVYEKAQRVYEALGAKDMIRLFAQQNAGHECTANMMQQVDLWMDKHLLL